MGKILLNWTSAAQIANQCLCFLSKVKYFIQLEKSISILCGFVVFILDLAGNLEDKFSVSL